MSDNRSPKEGYYGVMKTKKKLSEETAKRYCTADKKHKTKIIDEFVATTGYNRKYAIHILKNSARIKITHFNNVEKKSVQLITKVRKKRLFYLSLFTFVTKAQINAASSEIDISCNAAF